MKLKIKIKKTKFLLLFFITNYSFLYSQSKVDPLFYLNNIKVNFYKTFICKENIDSINVSKKEKNGAIYIYTKTKPFNFWTFSEVLNKFTPLKKIDSLTLVKINEKIINDLNNIKVDKLFDIHYQIDTIGDFEYMAKKYQKLKILNIVLNSNKDKKVILK